MIDPGRLWLFLTATLILLVIPGPAVTYIASRSLAEGRRSGLVSTLGIACGGLVHVAAAALGLSALLASSALAFRLVKYAGAAYLVFLGFKTLFGSDKSAELPDALNPKTWALLAGSAADWLKKRGGLVRSRRYVAGSMYLGLGLATALPGPKK